VAKNSSVTDCSLSVGWLPRTHDQNSLTLCWRSIPRWGREGIAICFADNGGQKFLYNWLQPIGSVITQEAWPNIVNALLIPIFMMGQGGYHNLFCLQRRPKIPLWLTTTYRQCDYPGHRTKNHWRSVDAHFQDGAGRVFQSVLPINASRNSFMTEWNELAVPLPRTHDWKLLMLHWRSFSRWGRERVIIMFAYKGSQYLDYV